MREDPNRRNVMATGVAAALAAPMSTLTAASVSANMGEDWPEFAEWVELVKKSDAQWQHLSDLNAVYAFNPDRPKLEEIWRLE